MKTENQKLGSEPAFAGLSEVSGSGYVYKDNYGMSKRFYAACQIAPSVIASSLTDKDVLRGIDKVMRETKRGVEEVVVNMIYEYVNELLKQENE